MSGYRETSPAACASDVTCKGCEEEVVKITFYPDRSSVGVCKCPWTSWLFHEDGKVFRSTPLGYEA